jgi:Uma2 family endonuclease
MSESTERVDRREKWLVYPHIPDLREYLLIAQDRQEALLYRHAGNWTSIHIAPGEVVNLESLGFAIPLASLYEGLSESA